MNLANCGIRVGDSQGVIWKDLENPWMLSAGVHMPAHSCSQKRPLLIHILHHVWAPLTGKTKTWTLWGKGNVVSRLSVPAHRRIWKGEKDASCSRHYWHFLVFLFSCCWALYQLTQWVYLSLPTPIFISFIFTALNMVMARKFDT